MGQGIFVDFFLFFLDSGILRTYAKKKWIFPLFLKVMKVTAKHKKLSKKANNCIKTAKAAALKRSQKKAQVAGLWLKFRGSYNIPAMADLGLSGRTLKHKWWTTNNKYLQL